MYSIKWIWFFVNFEVVFSLIYLYYNIMIKYSIVVVMDF